MIYYKKWSNFPRIVKFPAVFVEISRVGQFSNVFAARFQLGAASFLDVFNYAPAATDYCRFLMCTNMLWPVWFRLFSGQSSTCFLLQLCPYSYFFFLVRYVKSIIVDWRMTQYGVSYHGRNMTPSFSHFFERMHREYCLICMIFCCHYLIKDAVDQPSLTAHSTHNTNTEINLNKPK